MRHIACFFLLGLALFSPKSSGETMGFAPENALYLQDSLFRSEALIDEAQFDSTIAQVKEAFQPFAAAHGATIVIEGRWNEPTVAATTYHAGLQWITVVFGGLARRPEVTPDAFALVLFHEMGHNFGGYPFYSDYHSFGSVEGEADYYATFVGARVLWGEQLATNRRFRHSATIGIRQKCNAVYDDADEQNLCYRTMTASVSAARLVRIIHGGDEPSIDRQDDSVVALTVEAHPLPQCRLDTFIAGALCRAEFNRRVIPGLNHPDGQNGLSAEELAAQFSCTRDGEVGLGSRPQCWFAPLKGLKAESAHVNSGGNLIVPGHSAQIDFKLINSLSEAVSAAGELVLPATLTSSAPLLEYAAIAPTETASNSPSVTILAAAGAPCGIMVHPEIILHHQLGIDRSRFDLRIGSLARTDTHGSNDRKIIRPLDFQSWDLSLNTGSGMVHADLKVALESPPRQIHTLVFDLRRSDEEFWTLGYSPENLNEFKLSFDFDAAQSSGPWKLTMVNMGELPVEIESWELTVFEGSCGGVKN